MLQKTCSLLVEMDVGEVSTHELLRSVEKVEREEESELDRITACGWTSFIKRTMNWSSCWTGDEGVQVCPLCAPRCRHHQVQFLPSPRLSCGCAHAHTNAGFLCCFSFSVTHKLHRNILVHKCYRKTDATFIWILRPFKGGGEKWTTKKIVSVGWKDILRK